MKDSFRDSIVTTGDHPLGLELANWGGPTRLGRAHTGLMVKLGWIRPGIIYIRLLFCWPHQTLYLANRLAGQPIPMYKKKS